MFLWYCRDSLIIPVINCGTSIYAGFAIFSVLGYLADAKGLEVQDVAEGGMQPSTNRLQHQHLSLS